MGCDGGTIPRRDELVRTKKKPEKIERDIEDAAKWKYCALTQVALREPIAACYLGRLFNKEAVIEALLEKTIGENENASHIRSMKDIKTLNLTKNPSFDNSKVDKGDEYKDYNVTQFICPVVGIEMNGKYRFCVIWTCGCVLSERALKEVKSEVCHKCGKNYQHDDVIVLNGTDDEMDEYRKRKDKRRDAQSKSKKLTQSVPPVEIKNGDDQPSTSGTQSTAKADATKSSGPVSSSTVSCVSKLSGIKRKDGLADQSANAKKSKSLQDDPKASKVFKSLFTTSDAAKNQPKAHWGTVKGPPGCDFNPELAAQALRKAFRGLGTDERVLIDVLGSHNNWQRQEIKKRYKVVYGRDLISDLQDELGGHFLEACLALMCPSHVYDARCLRKALASSKADEHCVVEILCTKDCAELELIKGAYTQEFGDALESHLNSLNSGGLGAILKSLISTKREPNGQPDLKECEQDALKLIAAGPSQWLTGVAYLHQLLCLRTPQQLKFIFEAYRRKTKHDIEQEIRKEFEAEYRDGLLALVKITRNLIGYFADRLAECVQASITDDDALIRLLVGRSEIDLQTIKEEFQRKYKKSLAKAIRDECSGDYCRLLLKLIAES